MFCSSGNNVPNRQSTRSVADLQRGRVRLPSLDEASNARMYFSMPGTVLGGHKNYKVRISCEQVHQQVQQEPTVEKAELLGLDYPHSHENYEKHKFDIPWPWVSIPIILPEYTGKWPGPARALYNQEDRSVCAVIYHDVTLDLYVHPSGKVSTWHPFSAAVLETIPMNSAGSKACGSNGMGTFTPVVGSNGEDPEWPSLGSGRSKDTSA